MTAPTPFVSAFVLSFALLASLALVPAPAAAQDRAAAPAGWDDLVKAARAEGQVRVMLVGRMPRNLRKAMPEFEKLYGVRVLTDASGGVEQFAKILAERQVGRYTVDVMISGSNSANAQLIPNKALARFDRLLVLPGVNDRSRWFQGKHHYSDPEARYVFTWGASPSHLVSYNTNLVKPEEITSHWDLLDPKWKGRIVANSPATPGTVGTTGPMILNPKVGEDWFRRLMSEMDVTLVKDTRQGAEWIAMGKYAIGLFGLNTNAYQLAAEGFPIMGYLPHPLKEGETISSSGANIYVFENAPNPNAMKLFANWALTRDAQQAFVTAGQITDSLRTDIDNSVIDPAHRLERGRDYIVAFSNPDYIGRSAETMERLRRIVQESVAKQ